MINGHLCLTEYKYIHLMNRKRTAALDALIISGWNPNFFLDLDNEVKVISLFVVVHDMLFDLG